MTNPYLTVEHAAEHQRELRAAAARSRFIVLAQCCKPSRFAAFARATRARVAAVRSTRQRTACCA
jgi:hypothetical protein